MKIRHAILAAAFGCATLAAAAQSAPVRWAVSHYGPGTTGATIGCGTCASDQRAAAVDGAGHLVVTGFATTSTASDILTTKLDGATGAVLWQKTFDAGLGAHEQAWGLALDAGGNAFVTGYSYSGTEYDITTIKYASADGAELWRKTFTGPAAGIDFGIAVATDAAGNAFVGGNAWNGLDDDLKIIKYAGTDGAVLWDKTFAGAAAFNDYAFALAVDGGGNVIVAGEHQQSATDSDWKVIKYAAADGAILWQRDFAGAAGGLDIPFSVVLDAAGNAVVAGNTHNGTNFDARVAKYAAADGATLWEKTFAGVDAGDDMFYSVALDAAGNATVAGFTFTTAGGNDWNVVRYAASDGAILWQRTVGGTGNLSDVAVSVAIDSQGNAIAGGRINNSADAANRDMHAVKFAASDGATVWSYTHAGGAGAFDRVASVATRGIDVYLAGESEETGFAPAWRLVKLGIEPAASADLSVTLSAPATAASGKDAIFTLTASNAGPLGATGVVLTGSVPAGASFVWASPGCTHAAGTVTCAIGALANGASSQRRMVVRPAAAGPMTAGASVTGAQPDADPADNASGSTVAVTASPAGAPVLRYRLYSPVTSEHHFTTDLNEYTVLGALTGTWVQEGTVGKVLDNPGSFGGVAAVPYYRLYNPANRQHHWTSDANEYYTLVYVAGHSAEGVDGFILPTQATGTIPLYRLSYPYAVPVAGLHHWTIDPVEYGALIASFGWIGEGGSGFVIP